NLRLIEERLREIPEVTNLYITLGSGQDGRVNVGKILVQLTAQAQRSRSQGVIMKQARSLFADLKHLKISVENIPRVSGGGFRAAPLQYNLRGSNLDELDALSKTMIQKMREIPGIVDVNSTYEVGKPELVILPERSRAADLGVDIDKLGRSVQSLIGGQKASTLKEDGESYDARVRLVGADRTKPESLLKLPIKTKFGTMVQLRTVADIRSENGPVQIDRQNRQRQITIMANLEKSKPLASAIADVKRIEQSLNLPKDVTGAFTGPGDMMRESFESMNFTLFLAIVLIYMILAAQFESLIHPLTIMLSLPLSIGGALGALALTGRTLNIFTMIGMIMLMGLVTKNAILLVDYTNLLRSEGMTRREALLKAGPVRLRPILMTAFSTIVGMLPIAIGLGAGAETRAPMGTCVVGGMISSTLLTLIVIPAIYSVLDQWGDWVKGLVWGAGSEKPAGLLPKDGS
ncbi:MAG: efflux RND transporter permease subunit, partial [Planctomycetota bacterium]|nr:efflux RND transporter permease subunit [Planctomycetota bacterium]